MLSFAMHNTDTAILANLALENKSDECVPSLIAGIAVQIE